MAASGWTPAVDRGCTMQNDLFVSQQVMRRIDQQLLSRAGICGGLVRHETPDTDIYDQRLLCRMGRVWPVLRYVAPTAKW
jgi:hypothetical protein